MDAHEIIVPESKILDQNKEGTQSDTKYAVEVVSPRPVDERTLRTDNKSSCLVSEFANLTDITILDEKVDGAFDDNIVEKNKQDEIAKIIQRTKLKSSTSVDLCKMRLHEFPSALSHLQHLEYMYLEGNKIVSLPDKFFRMFPRLRWLDLRNNLLSKIPSAYLSSHSCLRNLLLEGNSLRNLPLELGLVKCLQGLNITGNPLDFPPQEIIEKGTQYILGFLKELFELSNSQQSDLGLNFSVPDGCEDHVSVSSDDWNTTASMMDLAKKREAMSKQQNESEIPEFVLRKENASKIKFNKLQKSSNYTKTKYQDNEKIKKVGASEITDRKSMSKLLWRINPYPPLPTQDYVTFRMNEEKHLVKVKELKEKIDALIQKQKDDVMLKKWRDVAKLLQQKKYSQRLRPGKDYKEPGEMAPFGIEAEMMKLLSKEDRLKADLQKEKELKEQRCVSPATRARKEQEKQNRVLELEQKIKQHTVAMIERRKHPKGTPQSEIEIARRELRIAEQLHSELLAQKHI